jgi:hypothetical protein
MRISSPAPVDGGARDGTGEKKQLGANFEAGRIGGRKVDVEANLVVHEVEADHSATIQEVVRFSNGQNGHIPQSREERRQMPVLSLVDDEHVAIMSGLGCVYLANANGSRSDLSSLKGAFQFVMQGVVFQGAQEKVAADERIGGPPDKLREMKKEGGLHLVFIGSRLRDCGVRDRGMKNEGEQQDRRQCRQPDAAGRRGTGKQHPDSRSRRLRVSVRKHT